MVNKWQPDFLDADKIVKNWPTILFKWMLGQKPDKHNHYKFLVSLYLYFYFYV